MSVTREQIDCEIMLARADLKRPRLSVARRIAADTIVAIDKERDEAIRLLRALRDGKTVGPDVDDFLATALQEPR